MRKGIVLAIAAVTLLVTGCNTIQGIGKDVEKVGEKVQGAAK
ncbi:MAG: entericidin A/B family lipoprotein [Pseudomonadota bacterium]|nr:entericidin A/B family lipoprotein [Pseudomonadota bacterium]